MEVLEAIKSGKSASKFKPTPVPEQKIQAVFNAARLAPSAENLQPWKFIVVRDEDVKKRIHLEGGDPLTSSAAEYAADVDKEETKWSTLIKKLNLKVE